jgi:type II secretory pathway component PulK
VNLNTAPAHVLGLIFHGAADDQRLLDQRDVFEILKARSEGKVFCPGAGQDPCTTFSGTVGIAEGEAIFPPLTYKSRVFAVDVEATVGETRACVHSVIDRGSNGQAKTLYYELGC